MKKNYLPLFTSLVILVSIADQLSKVWAVFTLGSHHFRSFTGFIKHYFLELGPVGIDRFPYINSIHHFKSSIALIPDWFEFYLTLNDGAAWSLLSGRPVLLAMISMIMIIIFSILWNIRYQHNFVLTIGFGMMIGGALGNFIDRWRLHVVIDFLKFSLPERVIKLPLLNDFPIFNLADAFAVSGILLIGLHLLLVELDRERKIKKTLNKAKYGEISSEIEDKTEVKEEIQKPKIDIDSSFVKTELEGISSTEKQNFDENELIVEKE